jgi:hypothetical protein
MKQLCIAMFVAALSLPPSRGAEVLERTMVLLPDGYGQSSGVYPLLLVFDGGDGGDGFLKRMQPYIEEAQKRFGKPIDETYWEANHPHRSRWPASDSRSDGGRPQEDNPTDEDDL